MVCVFMLSIAIKNLLYFLYHGSRESTQKRTEFKSTNFYRIIKSFVSVRNDAYTRIMSAGAQKNSKTTFFSTFSIFISFYSNGSAKSYKKYQIYGVYNFMPPMELDLFLLNGKMTGVQGNEVNFELILELSLLNYESI